MFDVWLLCLSQMRRIEFFFQILIGFRGSMIGV